MLLFSARFVTMTEWRATGFVSVSGVFIFFEWKVLYEHMVYRFMLIEHVSSF